MNFTIPSSTPPPTDEELSDFDLLYAYFEKNFADDPMLKDQLEKITADFVPASYTLDSYQDFSDLLAGEGIVCPVEWAVRAGGSGIYGSATAWTAKLSYTPSSPVAEKNETQKAELIASTPFATPQSALDGLKTKLTTHYQNTYEGLGQLLEPCARDGSVMLKVPTVIAGGFGIFTQAMIQGRENAIGGLKNILNTYAGITGPERDLTAEALFHFYERVFATALGPQWRESTEFKDYVTQFKADGNGSVNVLGMDPFANIEISTYDFTYSLFQKHPEAYAELGKIAESATFDLITTKVNEQMIRVSRALKEISAINSPDQMYDLIHNFANYGPAKKYIYDYLGITEDMGTSGQTQVGGTNQKPAGMDDQTWNLVTCLAQRKTAIERGETAFFVLSIGGSILAGIGATAGAGFLSGGNPVVMGYAASAAAMTAAGAIGNHMVNAAYNEREWGGAAQAVAAFEKIPLGSNEMVTFLDEKVEYTVISAVGNVVLAGVGAGAATKITQALSGQIVKRMMVQAMYGALDGTASVAIDGNVNNQDRLAQATILAGGKAEEAPTVTQVFVTAALLGGAFGGVGEAVFNPGEVKIALELATGKLKFYDAAGKLIPVKACVKVQGGVYKVTNDKNEVAYFRVNDQAVGAAVTKPKVAAKKPAPNKPKDDSAAPPAVPARRPATQEDVQAYLAAHPELKSQNVPDDVLAAAILRYLNNPGEEFAIGSFNTGHEFQEGADAAHAATTPLGNEDGYSAAEADFFGYESSAHFHGGKVSLDERMVQMAGQEFDDDLQFLAARARVHHQYNLNNADNPNASALPTTLTHEIFGVGADGQLAKFKITASYDPERDAVRFAINCVNVGDGTLGQVRARGLEVDNVVRAMPPGHLEQMAGQEAASVYDRRRLAADVVGGGGGSGGSTILRPLKPMPHGLQQQLQDLLPGKLVTIGRDAPLNGVDLDNVSVSRRHLQIQKNADETFTLIDISKAGTLIKKVDGTVYEVFVAVDAATQRPAHYVRNLKMGETQQGNEISLAAGDEVVFPNGERFVFEPSVVPPKFDAAVRQPMTGNNVYRSGVDVSHIFDSTGAAHVQAGPNQERLVVTIYVEDVVADNARILAGVIRDCQQTMGDYPGVYGFALYRASTAASQSSESLHLGLNSNYGVRTPVPVKPVSRRPTPDFITGRLNIGDEVYVPREKAQVAERGWKITAVDTEAQTVTVEKEFRSPDGRPMMMRKTIPAKDVAPPRAVEGNLTRNIDFVPKGEGFNHIRSREIYLRRYGVMDEATYARLFRGNFAQKDVGNCYLISAFNSLRTNEDTFGALVRTSLAVPGGKSFNPDGSISNTILAPGHYQVRVPFGQMQGEVVDIFDHELRSQWNKKFLATDKHSGRDLRPTLSPVEGPKGFQILEAVYIKLANKGILDRSAVEGGFSAPSLKKMFGENVHRRQYGSYHRDTKVFSDPANTSLRQQVHDYFLKFNNQKDICSVASQPNPRKGGHSDSYKVGKFRIYMSHSYSVESVILGPGVTPSTKVITGITVVNPWDTSKKMVMTEAEFMKAFAMIDAVRIDMKNMFDEAKPLNPNQSLP